MDVLRELPGADFTGENADVWGAIVGLDQALKKRRKIVETEGIRRKRRPWVLNSRAWRSSFLATYRDLLYTGLNWRVGEGVRMVGFKEVRWSLLQNPENPATLRLLLETFPCAKLILNYREDADAQSRSGFWKQKSGPAHVKGRRDAVEAKIERMNAALVAYAEAHPQNTMLMPLSKLSQKESLQAMVDWIGFPGCTVFAVPHENNKGTLSKIDKVEECTMDGGCLQPADYQNMYVNTTGC